MKTILFLLTAFIFSVMSFAQSSCKECWKMNSHKDSLYFNYYFSIITGNDPSLSLAKIDFENSSMTYVVSIKILRKFLQLKYSLQDTAVGKFTEKFLRDDKKISLIDTTVFKRIDSQFSAYNFFPNNQLDIYRNLSVKEFMLKYCEGAIFKDRGVPIKVIAYFFEKRIFWNNIDGRISQFALKQIESECKIKWNERLKKWQ